VGRFLDLAAAAGEGRVLAAAVLAVRVECWRCWRSHPNRRICVHYATMAAVNYAQIEGEN